MAKPTIVKLMVDGELEECLVRVDGNGEFACKSRSGRVFFFPAGSDLQAVVKMHNAANSEKPILANEAEDTTDDEWDNWSNSESSEPASSDEDAS